jgi:rRNA processing protein Gar1
MNWIKLNLNYIGTSKKSQIFRSKKFKEVQFNIHNPIYDKEMNKIGHIKDIFGPVDKPFVSIQLDNNKNHADFDFYSEFLYIKTKKSKN